MTVRVKHLNRHTFSEFNGLGYDSAVRAEFIRNNLKEYNEVAILRLRGSRELSMNDAFRFTQNQESGWAEDLATYQDFDIFVEHCRSTSVGDIFIVNEVEYFVDSYGFSPVKADSYE